MADSDVNFTDYSDPSLGGSPTNRDSIVAERDPLTLDLDDKVFIKTAKDLTKKSREYYEKNYNLKARRKRNEKYLFGRQIQDLKLKSYNTKYSYNVIYEGMSYLKPIALSKLPDLQVKPGTDTPESKQAADLISKVVDTDIKTEARRKVLGMAFKHLPIYFTGIIKVFWNPEIGKNGDFDFKVVLPENVVFDHTAATNDSKDMSFVDETVECSVTELVMHFPKKENDIYKELKKAGIFDGEKNEKNSIGMGSKINYHEIHFTHYEKKEKKYEMIECVGWYYNDLVLDKIRTPNWDWEGEKHLFSYDKPVDEKTLRESISNKEVTSQMSQMGISMTAQMPQPPQIEDQDTFRNHFEVPQKPYYFMGYDQWGKQPLDETSIIEQVIYLQDNVDKRGRQVSEMLDRSRGKHVFSTGSGLKKEDIEELDMANWDEDLLVDGAVNEVHAFIPGEQPTVAAIQDEKGQADRAFAIMGINSTVRGDVQTDVATTNQIAREADFTRADDYVEETINNASMWIANWELQMMKLRYTEDHFVRILGEDGKIAFDKVNHDMIEDGQEVIMSASGTDKLKAKQAAMDAAKLGVIDPFNFFKDSGYSDPEGRTSSLMEFKLNPNAYAAKYMKNNITAPELADQLNNTPQPGEQPDMSGGMGEVGGQATPPAPGGNVGPVAPQNPQPGNTAQVPVNPPPPPAR